jgi:[ribosomal protein S5]-alanine N-acetyltransferase
MNDWKTPLLSGKKVVLRSLLREDLTGRYFSWLNDPETCRFNAHGRFPNGEILMEEYLKKVTTSASDLVLAVVDLSTELHVGNISLQNISWIDRSAEYAILLGDSEHRGRGLAKEASDLILAHGFNQLNLRRIYCGTAEDNVPMQKLAHYMGMQPEGRRRQAMFKNNSYKDVLEFGILKEEFRK